MDSSTEVRHARMLSASARSCGSQPSTRSRAARCSMCPACHDAAAVARAESLARARSSISAQMEGGRTRATQRRRTALLLGGGWASEEEATDSGRLG